MSSFEKSRSKVNFNDGINESKDLETRTTSLEITISGLSEQLSLLTNMLLKQNNSIGKSNSRFEYSNLNQSNDNNSPSPASILANTCGLKPEDYNIFSPSRIEDEDIDDLMPFSLSNKPENHSHSTNLATKAPLTESSIINRQYESSSQENIPISIQFPNTDVWLSKELNKVKESDLAKGIDYRYTVYSSSFDFEKASNLRIFVPSNKTRLTTVIAPTGFSAWANFASSLNLHELDDGARYLGYKFYWLFTGGGERAPFFDTTNLHHFCSEAAFFFKGLNERYTFLRKIWYRKVNEEVISEAEDRDLCEIAYVDPTYSMRIYRKLYKCLEEAKKKWIQSKPCLAPINNPLPKERQRKKPTKSNGATNVNPSSLLHSRSLSLPVVPIMQTNYSVTQMVNENIAKNNSRKVPILTPKPINTVNLLKRKESQTAENNSSNVPFLQETCSYSNSKISILQNEDSQSMGIIPEINSQKVCKVGSNLKLQTPRGKLQRLANINNSVTSMAPSSSINIPESQVPESMQETVSANKDSAKLSCNPAQKVSSLDSLTKQSKQSNRQLLARDEKSKSNTSLKASVTRNTSSSNLTKQNSQSSSGTKSTTATSRKLNNETNQPVLSAKVSLPHLENDSSTLKSQDNLKKRRITKVSKLTY